MGRCSRDIVSAEKRVFDFLGVCSHYVEVGTIVGIGPEGGHVLHRRPKSII